MDVRDFRFTRDNPSLFFRSAESGSMLTLTWKDGLVFKTYNGRIAGRWWPLPHKPSSVEFFEAWCRQTFLLSRNWNMRQVTGFEAAQKEVA